jgi:hypothetical protein
MKTVRTVLFAAVLAAVMSMDNQAMACAACYGTSDSPMAQGMNAGILALLGVIGAVLCGAGAFFIFLAHRASVAAKTAKAVSASLSNS